MQSPTSTTWKPIPPIAPPAGTVLEPAVTSHRGSMILASASAEEIAAVEAAERIDEDPEAEEEAEEEDEEDEDRQEAREAEEKKKIKG
jgi:hypothetical protein